MGDSGSDNQINYKKLSLRSPSEMPLVENVFSNLQLASKLKSTAKPTLVIYYYLIVEERDKIYFVVKIFFYISKL